MLAIKGSGRAPSASLGSLPSEVRTNESGDLDNYLAKGASCQVFEGLVSVVERVGLIDNRANRMFAQEFVHAIEGSTRCHGNATNRGLAEDKRHEAQRGAETSFNYQVSSTVSTYMSYGRIIDAVINNPPAGTGAQLVVPEHTYKAGVQYRNNFMDGQLTLNADVYHLDGNPYSTGTDKHEMPPYTRYDLRATYDYNEYSFSVYGTFQPHRYGTEVAYGTNAGLVIVPQPSTTLGASVRYYF